MVSGFFFYHLKYDIRTPFLGVAIVYCEEVAMESIHLLRKRSGRGQRRASHCGHYAVCLFLIAALGLNIHAQVGDINADHASSTNFGDGGAFNEEQLKLPSTEGLDPALKNDEELSERGDYTAALHNLRGYVASHAESADAHYLLGYVLYRQDKPSESLEEYTSAARLRKPAANDLAVVAMDYVVLHDYKDADKWLTLAVTWAPDNTLYRYYLGRTKYNENHFQEAAQAFVKCLQLQPKDIPAEYNLGLSYAGLGRDDDAESTYRAAIRWQKDAAHEDAQPYLDLGMLLIEKNQTKASVTFLEKAVFLDPHNPKPHEQLGRAYEQLQMLAQAENELKAAVSLAPNIPPLHFELGRIYQKEGKSILAKQEFAKCASLSATHSTDSQETPNLVIPAN